MLTDTEMWEQVSDVQTDTNGVQYITVKGKKSKETHKIYINGTVDGVKSATETPEKELVTASQLANNDEVTIVAKSIIPSNPFNGLIAGDSARATILFSNGKELTIKAAFDSSGNKDYVIVGTGEWPDEEYSVEDPLYVYFNESSNLGPATVNSGWSSVVEISNEGINQCNSEQVGFTSTITSISLNGNSADLFDNFFEFYR